METAQRPDIPDTTARPLRRAIAQVQAILKTRAAKRIQMGILVGVFVIAVNQLDAAFEKPTIFLFAVAAPLTLAVSILLVLAVTGRGRPDSRSSAQPPPVERMTRPEDLENRPRLGSSPPEIRQTRRLRP